MPSKVTLAVLILLVPFVFSWGSQSTLGNEPADSILCSKDIEKKEEKKFGDYRIKIFYAGDRTCERLDILKKGQLLFRDEGIDNHYFLGNEDGGGDRRSTLNLIGRGVQLVVKKWTGGVHCCTSLLLFDLAPKFRKISEIYAGNFDTDIIDLNHDGIQEIRVVDDFLAYRFSCFAFSAKADVILKYTAAGTYEVAPELMRRPAPSWRKIIAKIPQWQRLLRGHSEPELPPPSLIQTMTDLIFTGNESVAFELLEQVWPPDVAGKANFLKSYREALTESIYYEDFRKKNRI